MDRPTFGLLNVQKKLKQTVYFPLLFQKMANFVNTARFRIKKGDDFY